MTDKCSHFLLFTIMAYHFTCLSCGVISILLLAYQQNLHCFKNSLKLELSHTPFYIKSVLLRKVWELVMVYCSPQGKSLSHCSEANDRDSSPLSLEWHPRFMSRAIGRAVANADLGLPLLVWNFCSKIELGQGWLGLQCFEPTSP